MPSEEITASKVVTQNNSLSHLRTSLVRAVENEEGAHPGGGRGWEWGGRLAAEGRGLRRGRGGCREEGCRLQSKILGGKA